MAQPIAAEVLADVSRLEYSPYKRCVSIFGSFVLWSLASADVPSSFWRCILHGRYSSVSLPGRVGRTSSPCLAYPAMGDSYLDGPVKKYMDDYYCMQTSNDSDLSEPMGLRHLTPGNPFLGCCRKRLNITSGYWCRMRQHLQ